LQIKGYNFGLMIVKSPNNAHWFFVIAKTF